MEKYIFLMPLLILFCVGASGCDGMNDPAKNDPDSNITVAPVDDPQLAKLILKPRQKAINVSRDPFKPLMDWNDKRNDAKVMAPVKQQFSDLTFIGMIKMGDQAIALLKSGDKKTMLKNNAAYKGFIVIEITNSQVTFSDGVTQITLRRGAKK